MRNILEYPITAREIEECLLTMAESIGGEGRCGDMRPILLRTAARIAATIPSHVDALQWLKDNADSRV